MSTMALLAPSGFLITFRIVPVSPVNLDQHARDHPQHQHYQDHNSQSQDDIRNGTSELAVSPAKPESAQAPAPYTDTVSRTRMNYTTQRQKWNELQRCVPTTVVAVVDTSPQHSWESKHQIIHSVRTSLPAPRYRGQAWRLSATVSYRLSYSVLRSPSYTPATIH